MLGNPFSPLPCFLPSHCPARLPLKASKEELLNYTLLKLQVGLLLPEADELAGFILSRANPLTTSVELSPNSYSFPFTFLLFSFTGPF